MVQILTTEQWNSIFGRVDETLSLAEIGDFSTAKRWYDEFKTNFYDFNILTGFQKRACESCGVSYQEFLDGNIDDMTLSDVNDLVLHDIKYAVCDLHTSFKYAGYGADKVSFVTDTGFCLKCQYSEWYQRKQLEIEIKTVLKFKDKSCFFTLLDYAKDYSSALCESCRESTEDDWNELITIPPKKLINAIIGMNNGDNDYKMMFDMICDYVNPEQRKVFVDLQQIFAAGNEFNDLYVAHNWGRTVRNGEHVLVVIDAGV